MAPSPSSNILQIALVELREGLKLRPSIAPVNTACPAIDQVTSSWELELLAVRGLEPVLRIVSIPLDLGTYSST